MEFILDMVHHNPGENPFKTVFTRPDTLVRYGYNGKVGKHIECALSYRHFGDDITPPGSAEELWMEALREEIRKEIEETKNAGLKVFYHIDLFVLPRRLTEKYREELCDEDGRIALAAPMTKTVLREMVREIFEVFPQVDGLIVRVGETYLYDAPYHVGNGPIRAGQYEKGEETVREEIERYVELITLLREEICEKQGRYLMFRTWDCFPDRFHADPEYYLAVTGCLKPHEKLLFSIKHTALDFWRRVRFNPCIGLGNHRQIIEVQCQREYEGKGACPDYIMDGVINGFLENREKKGLADIADNPMICGVYTWSRGGGWYGPYIENELWCCLHVYVIASWAGDPHQEEADIFRKFCSEELNMGEEDCERMRLLCRLSSEAVLKGRYCEAYDGQWEETITPTNLWMRDDRLGGKAQVEPIFAYLAEYGTLHEALEEKEQSMALWNDIVELADQIGTGDERNRSYIRLSARYGEALFGVVSRAWSIWTLEAQQELAGKKASEAFAAYESAWSKYRALEEIPECPSLYAGKYLNLPGTEEVDGMTAYMKELKEKSQNRSKREKK